MNTRNGFVALAFALVLTGCIDPKDRRPGLWLSGEVETAPVTDWSFTDDQPQIFLETRTWYGLRHSVTVVCASHDGALYVPSLYYGGGEFPDKRHWHRNVARDPRVRLQIGDRLYERRAVLVTDPAEWNAVLAAFGQKFPFWKELTEKPESERPKLIFMRMDPPADAA
jgi:F420H(2)-dependent quinone reductase